MNTKQPGKTARSPKSPGLRQQRGAVLDGLAQLERFFHCLIVRCDVFGTHHLPKAMSTELILQSVDTVMILHHKFKNPLVI